MMIDVNLEVVAAVIETAAAKAIVAGNATTGAAIGEHPITIGSTATVPRIPIPEPPEVYLHSPPPARAPAPALRAP